MSATAPLNFDLDTVEIVPEHAADDITIVPDAPAELTETVRAEPLRDPVMPFVYLGILTLVVIAVSAAIFALG